MADAAPPKFSSFKSSWTERLWDAWCFASIVGIWPRFIEPYLLFTNAVSLKIKELPPGLNGLRILHFSDLHLHDKVPYSFLEKLCRKAARFNPDIVVFTGDFICKANLGDAERLKWVLNNFPKGRSGSFAVLGNHDYNRFVTVNQEGIYDIEEKEKAPILQGIKQLFVRKRNPQGMALRVRSEPFNQQLIDLLSKSSFTLLHNETRQLKINDAVINVCGMGEYSLGRCEPDKAFADYDKSAPGIILTHHPDSIPLLEDYPATIIFSGHTHGAQINLPLLRRRFLLMENPQYVKGMIRLSDKWLYVSRGVGSLLPFRWFAPPEILCLTLTSQ